MIQQNDGYFGKEITSYCTTFIYYAIRKEYEDLKLKLAIEYPKDRATYTNMKSEFTKKIING